jgi:hypothetical protein
MMEAHEIAVAEPGTARRAALKTVCPDMSTLQTGVNV